MLGAALFAVLLFRRLGLGAVLGYLVAGIAIGPDGLGLVGGGATLMGLTEVGIVLLLFLVGLELSPKRLWQMRRDILLFGPLQVAICGLAMYGVILATMPFSWQAALVLALPLGLSSTAQVLPLLQSRGRMKTDYGEKTFSILLFQDLSIVPLLTIVAALSRAPQQEGAASGWTLAIYALLAIAGLVLAGRYLLSPLLRLVGKVSERELFIVTGLFAVCASAAVMQAIGLSAALGAFVAGVMLAESPYRHELEADIDPFRSILLGLFFLSVGMLLDLDVIAQQPLLDHRLGARAGGDQDRLDLCVGPPVWTDQHRVDHHGFVAQPGRRVRFCPVCRRAIGVAGGGRGSKSVWRGGDFVDGNHALPDDPCGAARGTTGTGQCGAD